VLSRDDIERYAAEGREAFEAGMKLEMCPYPLTSAAAHCWIRGYQNAQYGALQLRNARS
jgi:ribosome modulation factor